MHESNHEFISITAKSANRIIPITFLMEIFILHEILILRVVGMVGLLLKRGRSLVGRLLRDSVAEPRSAWETNTLHRKFHILFINLDSFVRFFVDLWVPWMPCDQSAVKGVAPIVAGGVV